MKVSDKIIVVTGGANGIGRALCRRFAQDGAKTVTVVDIDEEGAKAVADEINGFAITCDVTKEDEIFEVVTRTEEEIGPIDLFCSNAGILIMGCIEIMSVDWQRMWQINVMAQLYAAKALIPRMIERGGGYLLNMASAAGLLSQIGSGPYSVTKHAAVGLAEILAITYGDQGIKVSVVCPQAVRTAMTEENDDGGVSAVDGLMEPEQVADSVVEGLAEERFLILPHPEVQTYIERKVSDYDRWLNGMRRLQKRVLEGDALKG
jgi:NAD(P)-dependent dehydrogenase (short-subunit alcohol dehydrogenase family)